MEIRWDNVRRVGSADARAFWTSARALGLQCPVDVFEQLFFDHQHDVEFAELVEPVDWEGVTWEHQELSGATLRRVAVPRPYRHAVDEARWRTLELGLQDERSEVLEHWRAHGTWVRSPVLIAGELLGSCLGTECLVGFTRLGTLLGLLDRHDLSEQSMHPVWLGGALRSAPAA
jgi:hypothetical protein